MTHRFARPRPCVVRPVQPGLDVYEWSEACEADTIETPMPGEGDDRNVELTMVAAL